MGETHDGLHMAGTLQSCLDWKHGPMNTQMWVNLVHRELENCSAMWSGISVNVWADRLQWKHDCVCFMLDPHIHLAIPTKKKCTWRDFLTKILLSAVTPHWLTCSHLHHHCLCLPHPARACSFYESIISLFFWLYNFGVTCVHPSQHSVLMPRVVDLGTGAGLKPRPSGPGKTCSKAGAVGRSM